MTHPCEHIIGQILGYEDTRLVTLDSLKQHIRYQIELADLYNSNKAKALIGAMIERKKSFKVYSMADYCDSRKRTDLFRFDYCPLCGEPVDWKKIKEDNP